MKRARPATTDDLADLARLVDRARDELVGERGGPLWHLLHGRPQPSEAGLQADLAEAEAGSALVLLGLWDDVPAGYAVAHREDLSDGTAIAVVTDIYVEAGFRGVGVGEDLMDAVLAWAAAAGCRGVDALALPGMRASKNFFERYGLTARAILVHRALDPGDAPAGDEQGDPGGTGDG